MRRWSENITLNEYGIRATVFTIAQQPEGLYAVWKDIEYVVMDGSVKLLMSKQAVILVDAATVMASPGWSKRM